MLANIIHVEVIIIVFIAIIQWTDIKVQKKLCCKDNSRLVRKIVQSKWTPIFKKYHVKIPMDCPLHALRDIYGPREKLKKQNRPTQWTCKECGKSFYEEKYLDIHFERRHKNIINEHEDAVCFANFCDVMRCDVLSSEEAIFEVAEKVTDIEIWGDVMTDKSIFTQYNSLSPSVPRKRNFQAVNKKDKEEGNNHFYGRKLCQKQVYNQEKSNKKKSERLKERKSNGHKKQVPLPDDSKVWNGSSIPVQKSINNCNKEELAKLKSKCESLVRICMTGLLLQMSDNAFHEMEEELNKSICWYLTCDRYWEDGTVERRVFPWVLIFVIVTILSCGICFCYYIIWILFDSGENKTVMNTNKSLNRYNPSYSYTEFENVGPSNIAPKNAKYSENTTFQWDPFDVANNEHYIYVTYPPELKGTIIEN